MSQASSESARELADAVYAPSSVARLVYERRGDPYVAGYKPPTTRDIPQIKLPRLEEPPDSAQAVTQARRLATIGGQHTIEDLEPTLEPLETIPALFSSENFQLDNPRVFDEVIGDADSAVVQEKLSAYIDIVEAHLERAIATASAQFFAATSQFASIEEQAGQTGEQLRSFTESAKHQQRVVQHFTETAKLQQQLADTDALAGALQMLNVLKDMVSKADSSLADLNAAREFVNSQEIDLKRVRAAIPFLEMLDAAAVRRREATAVTYAVGMLANLRALVDNIAEEAKSSLDDAQLALNEATELGAREAAVQLYTQDVEKEVVRCVKSVLPDIARSASPVRRTSSPLSGSRSTSPMRGVSPMGSSLDQPLARALHSMTADAAEEMYTSMFTKVGGLLAALRAQVDSSQDLVESVVLRAVKQADSRLVQALRVRKDHLTGLSASQFVKTAQSVQQFCRQVSQLTNGGSASELSEFLVAQTKLYVHTLHTRADETLGRSMYADDWRRTEISSKTQLLVDAVGALGNFDADWDALEQASQSHSRQRVDVGSDTFLISRSTTTLITLCSPYLQLACALPQHAQDTAAALLELLRMYNNRMNHLILHFHATKTAGLKHISVKNLILAHECLRFVMTMLQPMQQCFERLGLANVSQFDSVQQLYFDHCAEISRRLVKLMGDKASAFAREIVKTDWTVQRPGEPNKYMTDLMRQTTTVANLVQEIMPAGVALKIVQEIYSVYKPKLLEAYSGIDVRTVKEKQNVLCDLAYFKQKSEPLRGAGNTADVVYESVNGFVAPELPDIQVLTLHALEPRKSDEPRRSLEVPEADASITFEENEEHDMRTEGHDAEKEVKQAETEKETSERVAREKGETEKLATEKAQQEPERQAIETQAAEEKAVTEKAVAEMAEAERKHALHLAADKAEQEALEKAAAEKAAAEKAAAEKAEAEKAEAERITAEKLAAEKAEKAAAEKAEVERLEAEKAEAKRIAAETAAAEKAEKAESDRLAAEKEAKEKAELAAAEKAEQDAKEAAKGEATAKEAAAKTAKERAEKDAAEKAEAGKSDAQRIDSAKIETDQSKSETAKAEKNDKNSSEVTPADPAPAVEPSKATKKNAKKKNKKKK